MKIGIIGNGFVGKATQILKCNDIQILVYDINPELCEPIGINLLDLIKCELLFISVPSPMNPDGSCHFQIVENVINNIRLLDPNYNSIIIGFCDNHNCSFMPEFLTEKNFKNDFINCKNWIFGIIHGNEYIKMLLTKLINFAYKNKKIKFNNITFVSNKEGEMIKYIRNTFLATKISYFNEIHNYCDTKNIDFNIVKQIACSDERIGLSHTNCPGHDGKKGFGGTCFPKDISSLQFDMKLNKIKSPIFDAVIYRNNNIDRIEQDWLIDKGRTNI